MRKYKCICCGYYTLEEEPNGSFEICPVCFWEDDNVQNKNESYEGGANRISLKEARENFRKFGASAKKYIANVRKPLPDETL